jgi:SAM-dependent methyltransferase
MLDLVRLSPRPLFPPGGEPLYRQIAVLAGMSAGTEVLDVGCGRAVSLEYFAREFEAQGAGIEQDAGLVQDAVDRIRARELGRRVQVQQAPADHLPYRDEVFDVAIGEVEMTASADPSAAVKELVRVTRPGGVVVLVQLVWLAPVEPRRRELLAEHLGVRPRMLVEWKRMLREAGVSELHTEDWSDPDTAFRPAGVKPFPDFAELFTLWEKIGILRRAWGRWGWTGVRTVLAREREVHRLLTRERVLGLDLIKGIKTASLERDESGAATTEPQAATTESDPATPESDPPVDPGETRGLPLFSPEST